jgi:protein-disulfide isomerase
MAESKTKSKAKKKAVPKKSASVKTSNKKTVAKKAPVVAANKKSTNVKAQPKKVENNKTDKTHVSSNVKESGNNWMFAAIILLLVIAALVGVLGYFIFSGSSDSSTDVPIDIEDPVVVTDGMVELLIVEDPSCINCQVDLFVEQVKVNLIPDLVATKITFDSEEGAAIVSELNVNQVPVYLFGTNIDQRDDWAEQLAGAFVQVEVLGKSYYLLNPQFIPNKVMIEDVVITDSAIVIGDVNAPVTVVEFTDFECPFCGIAEGNPDLVAQFSAQSPGYVPPMPKVIEEYVDAGLVKVVFYNFPIASLHPNSRIVHNAALCANEQGEFEVYSRNVWDSVSEWSSSTVDRVETLKTYAVDLGLDTEQFNTCLDAKTYDAQIDEELALGQGYGVSGTPAFFVGKAFISGAQDYTVFKDLIDAELAALEN